jgi:large subunit ribosomal protein L17e
LLLNAEANAEANTLDMEKLTVTHSQANRAPQYRRRKYRAHGRINAYMSSPAHLELMLEEPQEQVEKAVEKDTRMSNRRRARIAEKGGC